MRVWTIAANSVRRMLRDRTNLFFVFVLPVVSIVWLTMAAPSISQPMAPTSPQDGVG